jgi:hypothetical protein
MPLFAKKDSGLSAQERALSERMATLEAELRRLSQEAPTAVPAHPKPAPAVTATPEFAPPLRPASAPINSPNTGHFNDRGLRKFDLVAFWKNLKNHLSGSGGNNPAMVKMLAAGSIHGLRPLRRERRVARNRFIFLFLSLLAILWGLAYSYLRQR